MNYFMKCTIDFCSPDFWCLFPNAVLCPYHQNYLYEWYSLASKHQPMSFLPPYIFDLTLSSTYKYRYFPVSVSFLGAVGIKRNDRKNNEFLFIYNKTSINSSVDEEKKHHFLRSRKNKTLHLINIKIAQFIIIFFFS